MGFFDEVNKILGQAFSPNRPSGIGGSGYMSGSEGGGYGPDNRGFGSLPPPTQSPFSQDADRISSINQVNEQPFKIVDIDPYSLDPQTFACIYPKQTLDKLVGFESSYDYAASGTFSGSDGDAARYWRTVSLNVNGTFLKIEFLPNRISSQDRSLVNNAAGNLVADRSYPSAVDLSWNSPNYNNAFNDSYWINPVGNIFPGADSNEVLQGKKIVLISFDGQAQIPLIAEHGQIFKCPFNTVFVTMRSGSARIRLTTGYNTEITREVSDKSANSVLHMSTAQGFLEKPLLHFEPFCLTQNDGVTTGINRTLANVTAVEFILVQAATSVNGGTSQTKRGVACLWLNRFDVCLNANSGGGNLEGNLTIFISDTAGALRRIVHRQSFFKHGELNTYKANLQIFKDFSTPIRVSLHENEQLKLAIYNGDAAGSAMNFTYSISGYSYGRWDFTASGASTTQIPICLRDYINEHPYFLDNFRTVAENGVAASVVK